MEYPSGIWCLSNDTSPPAALAAPWVSGVSLRSTWDRIQPEFGTWVLGKLQTNIDKCKRAGKQVSLSVMAGLKSPRWVNDYGAQDFLGAEDDEEPWLPIPWDAVYRKWFTNLIDGLSHMLPGSDLSWLKATGLNWTTEEDSLPRSPADCAQWNQLDYSRHVLTDGWDLICDHWGSRFPNIPQAMQIVSEGLPPIGDSDATDTIGLFISHGMDRYKNKLLLQNNGLSARWHSEQVEAVKGLVHTGYQCVADVTSDCNAANPHATWRMNNGEPGDPVQIMQAALERAIGAGARYVEVYAADVANPALAGVLTDAANKLKGAP